jgi:hypothetical protein
MRCAVFTGGAVLGRGARQRVLYNAQNWGGSEKAATLDGQNLGVAKANVAGSRTSPSNRQLQSPRSKTLLNLGIRV